MNPCAFLLPTATTNALWRGRYGQDRSFPIDTIGMRYIFGGSGGQQRELCLLFKSSVAR